MMNGIDKTERPRKKQRTNVICPELVRSFTFISTCLVNGVHFFYCTWRHNRWRATFYKWQMRMAIGQWWSLQRLEALRKDPPPSLQRLNLEWTSLRQCVSSFRFESHRVRECCHQRWRSLNLTVERQAWSWGKDSRPPRSRRWNRSIRIVTYHSCSFIPHFTFVGGVVIDRSEER